MDFLICAYGEPGEERFVPFVRDAVDGFELQNYDRRGVVSSHDWEEVVREHRRLKEHLPGRLAIHGPYAGIDFGSRDCLLKEAVRRRMDLVYHMVADLRPDTLVLHTGCSDILVRFGLTDQWLDPAAAFWQAEIDRYAVLGVRVVLENIAEEQPDAMIELARRVDNRYFGLCLDVGHANLCSSIPPSEWIRRMGGSLMHVHLHDNNGERDEHLPLGRGTIDADAVFDALYRHVPEVTVSLEVLDEPEAVVQNALYVTQRYGKKRQQRTS